MNRKDTSIELLRVFAMIMIVGYHVFCHCINEQLISLRPNGFYSPDISMRLLVLVLVSPMGQMGNAIFIIISGYFMAHKGNNVDLTKTAKKLLSQLAFAAVIIGLAAIVTYNKFPQLSLELIDFNGFNNLSWFVGYYFVIIVLGKLFLNNLLDRMDKKNYIMFLAVIFAMVSLYYSRYILVNFVTGLEVIFTGIFLYSLGGFIRRYNPFEKIRAWALVAVIILINLLVCGNYYIEAAKNIQAYNAGEAGAFLQTIPLYANHQFVPIILAAAVFELFRRINIPESKIINYLGASTFMVYLLHDNEFVYSIWKMHDWITPLHDNMGMFFKDFFIWTMGTFCVGVLIYAVYMLVGKFLGIFRQLVYKK